MGEWFDDFASSTGSLDIETAPNQDGLPLETRDQDEVKKIDRTLLAVLYEEFETSQY